MVRAGERQISPPGGIGNSVGDFRLAFGEGERLGGGTIYQNAYKQGDRTLQVQFWLARRAGALRVELPAPGVPLQRAYEIAQEYLPYDSRMVRQPTETIQHYRSERFSDLMPDELLGEQMQPGTLFVRYNLTGGRVTRLTLGAGHPSG